MGLWQYIFTFVLSRTNSGTANFIIYGELGKKSSKIDLMKLAMSGCNYNHDQNDWNINQYPPPPEPPFNAESTVLMWWSD